MTNEPQADSAHDAFIERLTAHLDRSSADEPDVDTGPESGPEPTPDAGADIDPGWQSRLDGITATLSAPATWAEPPDIRSALLVRIRAQAKRSNGAVPAVASETQTSPQPSPAAPKLAVAPEPEPPPPAQEPATASPRNLTVAPEPAPAAQEPSPTAQEPAPAAQDPEPDPRVATVIPLRPRWQRLAVAVPVAAASAAILTLAILGVQRVLAPEPDEVFAAHGAGNLRAEVTVTSKPSGFEITLAADALPAAPAGSFYAAWLRRGPGPGDVIPIGTFHGRRVGDPIVLWSGVDPDEYRTFSVTLQRDGEPPVPNAPSARRVLLGTVDG